MDIEHVNLSVTDPRRTADLLERLFDWHTRWSGPAMAGGQTIHVGTDDTYLALYSRPGIEAAPPGDGRHTGLAHIGVLVDDLELVAKRVDEEGIETFSHDETPPGRRFYFVDHDGVCYEVASYH